MGKIVDIMAKAQQGEELDAALAAVPVKHVWGSLEPKKPRKKYTRQDTPLPSGKCLWVSSNKFEYECAGCRQTVILMDPARKESILASMAQHANFEEGGLRG